MTATTLISVQEAATMMGVSIATVRRMAARKQIGARKSGKQWLIDASTLSSAPRRRRVSATPPVDVDAALRYVRGTDLNEAFVPDVLRWADMLADPVDLVAAALTRFEGTPCDAAIEVEMDKTPFFTRNVVLLSLEDRVAYQAAVGALAARIEALTPAEVFSARLASSPRYFFRRGTTQWVDWRKHVLRDVEAGYEWMIKTDLTAYFDVIPHRNLIAEIQALNPDPRVMDALNEMLRTWAAVPGVGIPQGPNASRLLGNLYLVPVDRAMLAAGFRYSRFLDDVRVVSKTKAEAIAAIRLFQRECRTRGLVVSAAKTELLHGAAARADLRNDDERAAADYFVNVNATGLARKALMRILKRALKGDAQINVRDARFSLWRLARLRDRTMLASVMRRLEDLAPIASVVAAYLLPLVGDKRVVDGLTKFLKDDERAHSPFLVTWLFATMLERAGPLPLGWVDEAARRVKDRNQPAYLRAVAAVVLARGNRPADVAWMKADIHREHDPGVLRGYVVGLHWADALDRNTQRRLSLKSPRLAKSLVYLAGRKRLPSLVYPDGQLYIRP